jgi:hypothetical protein
LYESDTEDEDDSDTEDDNSDVEDERENNVYNYQYSAPLTMTTDAQNLSSNSSVTLIPVPDIYSPPIPLVPHRTRQRSTRPPVRPAASTISARLEARTAELLQLQSFAHSSSMQPPPVDETKPKSVMLKRLKHILTNKK